MFDETKGWNWNYYVSEHNHDGSFNLTFGEFKNRGIREKNLNDKTEQTEQIHDDTEHAEDSDEQEENIDDNSETTQDHGTENVEIQEQA